MQSLYYSYLSSKAQQKFGDQVLMFHVLLSLSTGSVSSGN